MFTEEDTVTNINPSNRMADFIKQFIKANQTLGQEVKEDINEILGEIYVIVAEDPWGEKCRRSGYVNEFALIETNKDECRLELTVETKYLSRFELGYICWDEKRGWTAHHHCQDGLIPLESLVVTFE